MSRSRSIAESGEHQLSYYHYVFAGTSGPESLLLLSERLVILPAGTDIMQGGRERVLEHNRAADVLKQFQPSCMEV